MLKFFNRLEKTRNFVLLAFSVLMVLSLVMFYQPRDAALGAGLTRSEETAAKVAGQYITVGEIARQKENFSRGGRGGSIPARTILNSLIGSRIARAEADRLGLRASDAEVADYIRTQYKPTDGKPFDKAAYEANAIEQEGSVSAFEERIRDGLSAQKLRAFLTSGISVSEEELLEDFKRKNVKFELSYVSVNPADLAPSITPTDQELHDYFDKNKAAYYISSPQKKIKYIFINTSKIGEKLNITDAELKAEYDKLPEDKKIAGVMGQEIVLRIPAPAQDADVFTKANQIRDRLVKESQFVTETEFADVAKGQSENPVTAPNGGRLKGPVRENPNNPTDPYQQLLKMKAGQVTAPIGYQGRYFILRRGDDVPKTFEMAKNELEVSLRNRRAYTVAAELAQKVADALKQNKDVQKTVADFAAQANMSASDMVKETAFVKPGDDVPNIGVSPQFEEGIAGLENANDVGDKIPVQNGFAIPLLVEKREPRDAEFDEVKAQVTEAVKMEKARAQVQEIANQIAAGATNVSGLAAAAGAKNLKVLEAKSYSLGSPLGTGPSASSNKELEDALYAMKDGEVTKKPINIGDNWFIVGVTKREDASMEQFAKDRDRLRDDMLDRKRGEFFNDYMSSTRLRMESDGSIKVYDDAIAKIDAQAAETELPTDLSTE
ncbi:MAG: SurA N-terminal domain-containing protein [Acidobacteria bacterium]|nr:SurA N-terminal domain-containing protein [Acidobacteriota bacterium]